MIRRADGRPARVDFFYEAERIVVEVTGHATHSTVAQRAADARRRNGLAAAGLYVMELTHQQVEQDPGHVAEVVLDLVMSRRRESA